MNIDELIVLYETHLNCQKLDPKAHAMRVVVEALRNIICDDLRMKTECCGRGVPSRDNQYEECCCNPIDSITRDNLIDSFNEILGEFVEAKDE